MPNTSVDPEDPLPATMETRINWARDVNKFESKLNPNFFKIGKDGGALNIVKDLQLAHSLGDPSDTGSKEAENGNENRNESPRVKRPKNTVNGTNIHEHGISQFNPGSAVYYDAQSDLKLSRFLRRS